ncbi:MAG: hypothetical protein CL915_01385 [Deltaproteobacteria bacterium]|nr:hypothetical protein [Deltaproteobacteria bacterium]
MNRRKFIQNASVVGGATALATSTFLLIYFLIIAVIQRPV